MQEEKERYGGISMKGEGLEPLERSVWIKG